ncbi:MAG: hemolysin family protein [Bacilli bacterium]|nr:hemolysin family protein [Bacilli bacterium]
MFANISKSVIRQGDTFLNPDSWPIYIGIIILLVFISSFFAASETAFSCLNKYRFETKADDGSKTAKLVLWVRKHYEQSLVSILIGTNVAAVLLSTISTALFTLWMGLGENLDWLTSLVASIVMTIIVYIFSETIPKQVSKRIPNRMASILCYPLSFFIILFYPISIVFRGIIALTKKITGSKGEEEFTESDFNSIIDLNEKEGLLEENESDLIQASFDFTDTSVKEVLTRPNKMFEIDIQGLTNSKLAEIICSTKYSRIPVYYGEKRRIIGTIIVKNFLAAYLKNPNIKLRDYIQKPYIVSPSIKMDDLVDGFKDHHTQIAYVMKDKELIGMVTMEDVLEELVGPISERNVLGEDGK